MLILVDANSPTPLYQQIHDHIVAGIATGELEPGTSLPSVRSLASDLGINLHTVNKAYAILCDEGYVRMRGRAGAVIAHPEDENRADRNRQALAETENALFKLALSYRAQGGTRGQFLECAAAQAARAYGAAPENDGKADQAKAASDASASISAKAKTIAKHANELADIAPSTTFANDLTAKKGVC